MSTCSRPSTVSVSLRGLFTSPSSSSFFASSSPSARVPFSGARRANRLLRLWLARSSRGGAGGDAAARRATGGVPASAPPLATPPSVPPHPPLHRPPWPRRAEGASACLQAAPTAPRPLVPEQLDEAGRVVVAHPLERPLGDVQHRHFAGHALRLALPGQQGRHQPHGRERALKHHPSRVHRAPPSGAAGARWPRRRVTKKPAPSTIAGARSTVA